MRALERASVKLQGSTLSQCSSGKVASACGGCERQRFQGTLCAAPGCSRLVQWADCSGLRPFQVPDQALVGSFAPPRLHAALESTACPLQGLVLEGAAVATAHLLPAGHAAPGPGAGPRWPSRTGPREEPAGAAGVGWGCGAGAPLCAAQQHLFRQPDEELHVCDFAGSLPGHHSLFTGEAAMPCLWQPARSWPAPPAAMSLAACQALYREHRARHPDTLLGSVNGAEH